MMRSLFPHTGIEGPSTWSITHVPPGTALYHEIDSGFDVPEIRLLIGEPELAELAMEPRVAMEMAAVLQRAIRECAET